MIFNRICQIIADQLDIDADSIRMESSIQDDLNADSLDVMEVAMAVGDEYDIEISEEELENIKTVGDVVRYVEAAVNDD
ncbi:acyl carrier protein [Ruminococcaceae bacterium FB2012]|nr:acyl carrier protein [Ruminococcaceae bacterium FB2012]